MSLSKNHLPKAQVKRLKGIIHTIFIFKDHSCSIILKANL
jgi:hypothetical protein